MNKIPPGTRFKVFLVEEGDDLRERVISATAKSVQIDYEPLYDFRVDSAYIYKQANKVTLTIELIEREDGTFYTIENFLEEDQNERAD